MGEVYRAARYETQARSRIQNSAGRVLERTGWGLEKFVTESDDQMHANFSPNGRLVSYISRDSAGLKSGSRLFRGRTGSGLYPPKADTNLAGGRTDVKSTIFLKTGNSWRYRSSLVRPSLFPRCCFKLAYPPVSQRIARTTSRVETANVSSSTLNSERPSRLPSRWSSTGRLLLVRRNQVDGKLQSISRTFP